MRISNKCSLLLGWEEVFFYLLANFLIKYRPKIHSKIVLTVLVSLAIVSSSEVFCLPGKFLRSKRVLRMFKTLEL